MCCGIRWLQEHATGSCPEQDTAIPHPPFAFFKMHFNIVLPSTPISSMRSLSIRFSIRNFVCNFIFPSVCYMLGRSHSPWFDHRNKIWWTIQIIGALHNAVLSSHVSLPLSSFPDTFLNSLFSSSSICVLSSVWKTTFFEFVLWNVKQFVDRRLNDMHIASLTVRHVLWAYSRNVNLFTL